ncbi:hypothetical protein GGR41_002055 [Paenalcaligenes hominis]|uniref:Uncharacterized protein n=1 Tax=Paenalcaligenes hominis TaxID=643674 RepID=A0ABX0WSQ2_9BURK|nr:hypothetical protein [Paenalcaligenes hominis]NJB65800.1 hypothetical protein [Paenalcaligenes hominis]GGE69852.1 hypothetical protein GCM10007278_17380 [Paenalcaligenes hominis]
MSTDTPLEQQFETALRACIQHAADLDPPVRFTRLSKLVNQIGAKAAADRVLANERVGDGLANLALTGLENLQYSIEHLVQQEPWSALFTAEQLAIAKKRLQ